MADELDAAIDGLLRETPFDRRAAWIASHENLLKPEALERISMLQGACVHDGDFERAAALAEAEYSLRSYRETEVRPISTDDERLSIKELALRFSRWFRAGMKVSLWEGTPYPEIAAAVASLAKRMDGKQIEDAASHFFDLARTANEDKRPRTVIENISYALAFHSFAGRADDIAAAINNLAAALSQTCKFEPALRLQRYALWFKRRTGGRPGVIARAHRMIGEIHAQTGDYRLALDEMYRAKEVYPESAEPDTWISTLQRMNALLEDMAGFEAAQASQDSSLELLKRGDALNASHEYFDAVRMYSRAASAAKVQADPETELNARMKLANNLSTGVRMFREAQSQFSAAARLAATLGRKDAQIGALYGQAQTQAEMGLIGQSRATLESAIALARLSTSSEILRDLLVQLALHYLLDDLAHEGTEYLQLALSQVLKAGDVGEAVQWLKSAGTLFRSQDFIEESFLCLHTAAELFSRLPRASHLGTGADLYYEIARTHFVAGQNSQAEVALCSSTEYAIEAGDAERSAGNWVKVGWTRLRMKNAQGALDAADNAEQWAKDLESSHPIVANLGELKLQASLEQLHWLTTTKVPGALAALETMQVGTAAYEATLDSFRTLIERPGDAVDPIFLSDLHNGFATQLERGGRFVEARQHFRIARRLARRHAPAAMGSIMHNCGVLLARQSRMHSARRAFHLALSYKDKYARGEERHSSVVCLAQACAVLQRTAEAAEYGSQAEEAFSRMSDGEIGRTLGMLADIDLQGGMVSQGLARLERAIPILKGSGPPENYIQALNTSARLHFAKGDLASALSKAEEASQLLEDIRGNVLEQYRPSSQGQVQVVLETLLRIHFALKSQPQTALGLVERSKWRTLVERLGEDILAPPDTFPSQLKRQEDDHLSRLRVNRKLEALERGRDPLKVQIFRSGVRESREQATRFWEGLPPEWSAYGKLRLGRPPDGTELLKGLRVLPQSDIVVLYPSEDGTYVWHITEKGELGEWQRLPISRSGLRRLTTHVLDEMQSKRPLPKEADQLAVGLSPVISSIPAGRVICFVPAGPLVQFPFAALPYEGRDLIERNPLATLPSLSASAYWRATETLRGIRAVVLGDSTGDLPEARKEADYVARLFGVEPHLQHRVVRFNVVDSISSCSLLHVACHAQFVASAPSLSGFSLADGSTLSARELRELNLRARLVVLSGCESGRVEVLAGDEAIGLSASILYAGAQAVIASLWRVHDEQTRHLMSTFYSELVHNRADLARALQSAQCHVLSRSGTRSRHPYYWAAFQLLGNWRAI